MDYLIAFADETDASKVAHDLLPFFEAVIKEVARHVPEKGYTFKDPKYREMLAKMASKRADDYLSETKVALQRPVTKHRNPGEALDATAFLAFSWLHETGKISQDCAALRTEKQ